MGRTFLTSNSPAVGKLSTPASAASTPSKTLPPSGQFSPNSNFTPDPSSIGQGSLDSSAQSLLTQLMQLLQRLLGTQGAGSSAPSGSTSLPTCPPPASVPQVSSSSGSNALAGNLPPIRASGNVVINSDGTYTAGNTQGVVNGNDIRASGSVVIHGHPNIGSVTASGNIISDVAPNGPVTASGNVLFGPSTD